MTGFRGIEAKKQGNVYFAGEHTSIRNPSTMDGAVESGERAAREIIRDIRRAR